MNTNNYGLVYPSCEILVNGQKRKFYGKNKNKVYLNNGDEFQLKVYNPLSERFGFQLKMNGFDTDNGLLIVNPGQTAIIERFIGTNRKLKFTTYVVDKNNPQTKQAIKDNGRLEVIFWNEYKSNYTVQPYIPYNPITTIPYIPYVPITPYPYHYYPNNYWYTSSGTGNGTTTFRTTTNLTSNVSNLLGTAASNITASNSDFEVKGDLQIDGNLNLNGNLNVNGELKTKRTRLGETGRIEKGNHSNQYFSQTEFKSGTIIKTYVFKLLPYSEKKDDKPTQTTSNTNPYILQNQPQVFNNSYVRSEYREYCPNKRCNYRIRKNNWGFCPVCGTKID